MLLVPLFQNMSPLGEDIRLWAPVRPTGYLSDPDSAFVPTNFHGSSMNDVGQSFFDTNFGEMTHYWEGYLGHWGPDTYTHDDLFGVSSSSVKDGSTGTFRWGFPNPSLMRVSYLGAGRIKGYKLICDVGAGSGGAKFALSKRIDRHVNLEMSHQTSDRQSQINMQWDW